MWGDPRGSDPAGGAPWTLPGIGMDRMRYAVTALQRGLPGPKVLRNDAVAGLTVTVSSVPDGMANGLLAGVNPIYGLYANMVAPVVGGLLSSSRLMVINSTSAAALVAGQSLLDFSGEDRAGALFLMVILTGLIAITLGLLRLGRLVRFVSLSVMTGFVTGIAVVLILTQLPIVSGIAPTGDSLLTRTVDLVTNIDRIHLPSLALALLALALAVGLRRTPWLGRISSLIAVGVPTALAFGLSLDGVATVGDIGTISSRLPLPQLPALSHLSVDLVTGAFSVAVIVIIQGAGVSESAPNPDGSPRSTSRDITAQGAANVAAGLFSGLPVGGSLSGTAISIISGASRRWAAIFSGILMVVVVVALPHLISAVVMPALGALLVAAGVSSIRPAEVRAVWRAGRIPRLAAGTVLVALLVLPVQLAVATGVVLSIAIYVIRAGSNVVLVEQYERADGQFAERMPPSRLPDRSITVFDVYGSLFFASARKLGQLLPDPKGSKHPVVILRLRGTTPLEATLARVLSDYADKLVAAQGRLYIVGLGEAERDHLFRTGKFAATGAVQTHEATPVIGESIRTARDDAQRWLDSLPDDGPATDRGDG